MTSFAHATDELSTMASLDMANNKQTLHNSKISQLHFLTLPGDNTLQFQKALLLTATASFDRELVHMGQQDVGSEGRGPCYEILTK